MELRPCPPLHDDSEFVSELPEGKSVTMRQKPPSAEQILRPAGEVQCHAESIDV